LHEISEVPNIPDRPGLSRTDDTPQAVATTVRASLSLHILPTAATMVGVCMTVLSIGRLSNVGKLGVVVDKMLAFDSVIFLVSAVFSFVAIRMVTRAGRLETWAEELFLLGLSLSAIVAVVIAFAIDL
jgi:hypothetical protein